MIGSLDGIEPSDLFTQDDGSVWRVVSFCERPTITLRNLETGETVSGAVGCRLLEPFRWLASGRRGNAPPLDPDTIPTI